MEDLHELIYQSKFRLQLFLCMYAGLRDGESCTRWGRLSINDHFRDLRVSSF